MYKAVTIFDLDGTVIDSSHRTPTNPDGTLNLQKYFENKTRESVFADTLLPLANVMKNCFHNNCFVIICTARDMNKDDYDYLDVHGLRSHVRLNRNKHRELVTDFSMPSMELVRAINEGKVSIKPSYRFSDPEYKYASLLEYFFNPELAGLPYYFFEDSPAILKKFRPLKDYLNLHTYNAITLNERL